MPQGDAEWHAARLGKVTASRMGDMTGTVAKGWGAARASYLAELVSERLSGTPFPAYVSGPMAAGTLNEPVARAEYEFEKRVSVTEAGFVPHPLIHMAGASPDGFVGVEGLVEIKCQQQAGHLETLRNRKISDRHLKQIHFQLACTGRLWCDYVAFNPNYPPPYRVWISRVYRDDDRIAILEDQVRVFLAEVDQAMAELRDIYEREQAA